MKVFNFNILSMLSNKSIVNVQKAFSTIKFVFSSKFFSKEKREKLYVNDKQPIRSNQLDTLMVPVNRSPFM